ncbi:MAG TPA: amino acid ABC transporter permease [Anaerolineales bacterium]|nr:amino acid ABC transporter permease [Anaerolineales bacterium]
MSSVARERPEIRSPDELGRGRSFLGALPWWAIIIVATGLVLTYLIFADRAYSDTFTYLAVGVRVTIRITLISYILASLVGLITGLARTSKNTILYTVSTLYVETARGVPLIVLMLYVAFVMVPAGVAIIHGIGALATSIGLGSLLGGLADLSIRQINIEARGIIALAAGYAAYEAEVFRAGIQSISRGQTEAARSLGMTYAQAMRFIILPQAIRRVLPPLGNDFISMLKDSSLLTVLAVPELTQLGRLRRSSTFRVFETFNVVTFLYLAMTLALSAVVRFIEQRMKIEE